MIERKTEMQKDGITKNIDESLVSLYLNMGWSKGNKEKPFEKITTKESKKLFNKD